MTWGARRRWRFPGVFSDFLIIHSLELTAEERRAQVSHLTCISLLDRWLASSYAEAVFEMYRSLGGFRWTGSIVPAQEWHMRQLRHRIEEAFLNGELAVLELPPPRSSTLQSPPRQASASHPPAAVALPSLSWESSEVARSFTPTEEPRTFTKSEPIAEPVGIEAPTPTFVAFKLVDDTGRAIPRVRYRVELPDGSVREGAVDDNGEAREDDCTPGRCRISLIELTSAFSR
jgi:hypothetical protein